MREAIERVIPVATLRYVSFSHVEADECGSLNQFLALAPRAVPLCGQIAAMVSIGDLADRPPRALADRERLYARAAHGAVDRRAASAARMGVRLPQRRSRRARCSAAICSRNSASTTRAITEQDILEPSEAARAGMDYYSHSPDTGRLLERLADTAPTTLALMHGPAWRGDGAALLRSLASRLRRCHSCSDTESARAIRASLRMQHGLSFTQHIGKARGA